MSIQIRLSSLLIIFLAAFAPMASAQPGPPELNLVTSDGKSVQVTFGKVTGALFYNVYWSKSPGVTKANAQGTKKLEGYAGTIDQLDDPSGLYFAGTVVTSSGESSTSNEMKATAAGPVEPLQTSGGAAASSVQPTTNVGQSADTNVQNPTMTFVSFSAAAYPIVDRKDGDAIGTITYDPTGVENLVKGSCPTSASALKERSTFVLINVINLGGTTDAQNLASSNWYVYSDRMSFGTGFLGGWKLSNFDGATRLYGAKRILLITILENDRTTYGPGHGPAIQYKLTITKQQATNVSDAVQLLALVFPQSPAAGTEATPTNYWACSAVPVTYKTSTIKVDLNYTAPGNSTAYTPSQSFVNEAKEYWDVSFALPVKKVSALQYNSTADTVTASQINKQALYAVFDWYPYPVDLKNSKFSYIPGIFAGVAMNSQPLHSLIFGASVGTKFAQLYAGALLLKQEALNGLVTGGTGSPANVASATSYVYKPQFSIGIKISISSAASALKGSK